MCTVSVVRPIVGLRAGSPALDPVLVRVVVNRDERRGRPQARPPITLDGIVARAVMPVDPVGPGTWMAASDAGLVFALLNGDDAAVSRHVDPAAPSRGQIIPALLTCVSTADIRHRLLSLGFSTFRPWRLVVVSDGRLLEAKPEGRSVQCRDVRLPRRFMTTSSSLNPSRAHAIRRRLFNEIVTMPHPAKQDRFHVHQWPDEPELSVRMERPEARSVSRSVAEITPNGIVFTYQPFEGAATVVRLERRHRGRDAA